MADGNLPEHLGGHYNRCHLDSGVLEYLRKELKIESMIDVGCGTGGMVDLALDLGIDAIGIDGDDTIERTVPIIIHDYREMPPEMGADLIWSVEFVEHMDSQYIYNFMQTFKQGKYVCMTHAPPNSKGHHHVNCQPEGYWVDKMEEFGLCFLPKLTKEIRKRSTMERDFMRRHGLMFSV